MDCPFCAGSGEIEEVGLGSYPVYAVICGGCGAVGPARDTSADAGLAWASRLPAAGVPLIPAQIRRASPDWRGLMTTPNPRSTSDD